VLVGFLITLRRTFENTHANKDRNPGVGKVLI
jgi:hypothetical protein